MSKPRVTQAASTGPKQQKAVGSSPMTHCLKVKVVIVDADDREVADWVEAANYHSDGGQSAFIEMMRQYPDDGFMTADANRSFSFADVVAILRRPGSNEEIAIEAELSPPEAPKLHYRRLKVQLGHNHEEIVEVANVPWDESGIAHFATLNAKYHNYDFVTNDFGFVPGRGIIPSQLGMPDDPPPSKLVGMNPRDGVSLKDYPE